MPGTDPDPGDGASAKQSAWQRFRGAILKPDATGGSPADETKFDGKVPTTVEELESAVARADDKERLIGLVMAPLAAGIVVLITGSLIANDPKAHLASGAINKAHVNPSLYLELGAVTAALAVLMLVMALLRKRLYLGIVMALYGLSIFNLHFWGFGIPFIMVGAWYLVRAYRFQNKLKEAKSDAPGRIASGPSGSRAANKRYTPPAPPPGRAKRRAS
jgi:hypothetical protein